MSFLHLPTNLQIYFFYKTEMEAVDGSHRGKNIFGFFVQFSHFCEENIVTFLVLLCDILSNDSSLSGILSNDNLILDCRHFTIS